MMKRACLLFVVLASLVHGAFAHESRPAYLELKETVPGCYDVLWRTPLLAGMRLPVRLVFPEAVRHVTEPREHVLADSVVERRVIDAGTGGLGGQRLQFVGLQATITDVLVRVSLLDGAYWTVLVRPSQPWVEFTGAKSALEVARTYLLYGVEHIVFGVDHLLFVFGLLLIVQDRWMLLKTVTSFTLAHSLTLAVATLGYASAPMLPLNATIALSILFLGPEIVRSWRGETSLTLRHPWLVAFVCGLLHGFGFASALTGAGLPRRDLPLALGTFNVGVELGQVAFVVLMVRLERSFQQLEIRWPRWVAMVPGYVVGVLDHPTHRHAHRRDQMIPRRQHRVRLGVRPMGALGWLVLLAWPLTALAHTQGGEALGLSRGVYHPMSGLDHVLAMVAVGVWGAQLGPPAVWL